MAENQLEREMTIEINTAELERQVGHLRVCLAECAAALEKLVAGLNEHEQEDQ